MEDMVIVEAMVTMHMVMEVTVIMEGMVKLLEAMVKLLEAMVKLLEAMATIMVALDILSNRHTNPSLKLTLKLLKLRRRTHKLKHTKAHILTNNLAMWILQTMFKPQLMAIRSNIKPPILNKLSNISKLFRILLQQ